MSSLKGFLSRGPTAQAAVFKAIYNTIGASAFKITLVHWFGKKSTLTDMLGQTVRLSELRGVSYFIGYDRSEEK